MQTAKGLIRRMQRTTKHLKSFGRKEAGELMLIDLRPVITSALELVTPRARAVGITPVLSLPDDAVWVMAGSVRMEQVAVNLILNALDAVEGRPDAKIDVRLTREKASGLLTVSDTGTGIAPDDLPRVAEPFFSTKTQGEGLGLGLSICKAIITEFGGTLTLQSTAGKGTTVRVALPIAEPIREAAE